MLTRLTIDPNSDQQGHFDVSIDTGHHFQSFDFNLRTILTILFKHKGKIAVIFLIILLLGVYFAFQTHSLYEAKSVLLVKQGREFLKLPDAVSGGPSIPYDSIIRGEVSILRSQEVTKKVIRSIGTTALYPQFGHTKMGEYAVEQAAIKLFEKNLNIVTPSSALIEITFTHSNPYVATQVVNTLIEAFKERHLEVLGGNSTEFLEKQRDVFQEKLRESERKLADFKERTGVYSPEEQRTALIEQRTTVYNNLKAMQSQIMELEKRAVSIQNPRWTAEIPQDIRMAAAAAQQREREFLQKYNETSAVIQNVRDDIQAARDAASRYAEQAREIELRKVGDELEIAKARAQHFQRQLAHMDGVLHTMDVNGQEFKELRRDAAQQEQNYQIYAKKLEDAMIMDDMDRRKMVAISVVEKAVFSPLPKKQKLGRKNIILVGLFGGVAAGIGFAFLVEFLSSGMTTPTGAEKRLGLPVMVAIAKKT